VENNNLEYYKENAMYRNKKEREEIEREIRVLHGSLWPTFTRSLIGYIIIIFSMCVRSYL
jgi:hypothetical protein